MLTNPQPVARYKDLVHAGTFISPSHARHMIEAWQSANPDAVRSILYGRNVFDNLLQTPGCAGIRIFNGINADNIQALVFVPFNEQGDNILEYLAQAPYGLIKMNAPIFDEGIPCPPFCPSDPPFAQRSPEEKATMRQRYPASIRETGSVISRREAQEMIEAWQQQEPDGVRSIMYGRHIFDALLRIPGCEGIRIFNAADHDQQQTFLLLASDSRGEHILQYNHDIRLQTPPEPIGSGGAPCPGICGSAGDGLPDWETHNVR
ncbi:hypothetical protein [Chitinophaga solisilvae]|uniref:hypothetical protein n=1 Tax=Chitinophaga solisilvae TaxID=1233460 RepID=UPI00136DADC6|nr:hypothetical protein [Chitinophaga solisilvae]